MNTRAENAEAEKLWDKWVAGANVITPHRMQCGYTSDGSVYELCRGDGMDRSTFMYAVTVLTERDDGSWGIDTSLSRLFNRGSQSQRFADAIEYIRSL